MTVENTQGEDTVKVTGVTEVEGDVELGQRKSKLLTIYDCRVVVEWNATGKDETNVKGSVTIPEVSHENTLDGVSDYQYEWKLVTSSGEHSMVNQLFAHVKKTLPGLLEEKFSLFPKALLDTHGKDLTVTVDGTPNASGTSTPIPKAAPVPKATTAAKATTKATAIINTASVKVSSRFMASADDLFSLLTDEKRIPIWSKAPAKSKPEVGSTFSLFSNGVTGEYVEVERPMKIVQKWKLTGGSWPDDHHATLTTTLFQDSDSTTVDMVLDGVPRGKEEEVERGLEGYYIRGLKSIGLGTVL